MADGAALTTLVCCAEITPVTTRAILQLRGVCDEVVTAARSGASSAELDALRRVSDRVVQADDFSELKRAMRTECPADWILLLDADEILGQAFVEQLPALLRAEGVENWFVDCRAVFPDFRHWLRQSPWFPNYEPRLRRTRTASTPSRRAKGAIYDVGFLSTSATRRWEAALRDDVEATASTNEGDARRGFAFRLPERHARLVLGRLDESDCRAVEAVCAQLRAPAADERPRWREEKSVGVTTRAGHKAVAATVGDRTEVEQLTMATARHASPTIASGYGPEPRGEAIPRILHRIWLGGQPVPREFHRYAESWERHHPTWRHIVWSEENLPRLGCLDVLDRARFFAEQADVIRYELLVRFGGVYVDMDFECLRPLDPLLQGVEAFAGLERPGWVQNAILGARPRHPAFAAALSNAIKLVGLGGHTIHATGPFLLSRVLAEFPDVVLFAPHIFYPQRWQEARVEPRRLTRSYAVHRWAKSHVGRTETDNVNSVTSALGVPPSMTTPSDSASRSASRGARRA